MAINELIQRAKREREENKSSYETKKTNIGRWRNGVEAIRSTFIKDSSNLWTEMVNGLNMQGIWQQICDLIGDEKVEGSLYDNLLKLGDGEKPGLFTTAYHRICRDKINLGVVGAFRQGKSTLLQQYICPTNGVIAPQQIIPHNNGGIPCTGTSINYIYSSSDTPTAKVHFYTSKEMCEMINEYIKEIKIKDWELIDTKRSVSVRTIIDYCQNHRTQTNDIDDAQENSLEATFKNIITHYEDYCEFLDRDDESIEDLTQATNRATFYERTTFNFDTIHDNYSVYAVKSVDVFVRFTINGEEVMDIQFLDTPGIGENRVGVDETLRDKLQNDIDTVIAVEKAVSDAVPGEALRKFHTSLKTNFGYAKGFAYYIIANTVGNNVNLVSQAYRRAFANGIETTPSPLYLEQNHKLIIDNRQNEVYNYSTKYDGEIDSLEVDPTRNCQTILYEVLSNLALNIGQFDQTCTDRANNLYLTVKNQVRQIYNLMNEIAQNNNIGTDAETIVRIIANLRTDIKNEVEAYYEGITHNIRSTINDYAMEDTAGKEVLKAIAPNAPTLDSVKMDQILKATHDAQEDKAEVFADETTKVVGFNTPCTKDDYDKWREFDVYCKFKQRMHRNICIQLETLIDADQIQKSVNDANNELLKVFRRPGYFGFLCNKEADNSEWFSALMNSVSDPYWKQCFSALFQFDVHKKVQEFIAENIVESIIKNYMHKDTFKGLAFEGIKRANKSFIKSLWSIEDGIKASLRDEYTPLKDKLSDVLDGAYTNVRREALLGFDHDTPLYYSILRYIGNHYNDILECSGNADAMAKKQALANQWISITKDMC